MSCICGTFFLFLFPQKTSNMNIILSDAGLHKQLLPITYTRPIAEIRAGIFTIKERWAKFLSGTYSYHTEKYLSGKYQTNAASSNLVIDASIIPSNDLIEAIKKMKQGNLVYNEQVIAAWCSPEKIPTALNSIDSDSTIFKGKLIRIEHVWDIFSKAGELIQIDFDIITKNRNSAELSSTNTVIGDHPVFLEKGAEAECCIFNTQNGPIYLGTDSLAMEGSKIRGPFCLGEHAVLKMDAKIYGPTSLGPHCRAGGELNNVVMFGYSNKGHDGFLGNAVIGEWCNLGADTNNSNLKNNYAEVKLWSYNENKFVKTGLQFCGLIMGDHSKCGINTMFNTGTVVGVSANIFGSGFPRNIINSFAWGGAHGFTTFKFEKAIEVAEKMMERRNLDLSEQDRHILAYIYEICKSQN